MNPFPVILASGDVNDDISAIMGAFAIYVTDIVRGGIARSALPRDFFDLYALDYYYSQVCNGGHCQFIGNSGGMLDANVDHALRGSEMLAMPELGRLLTECRDWSDANPEERDKLAGWELWPEALERLDDRFFEDDFMEFDVTGHSAYVACQSECVRAWIENATRRTSFRSRNKYSLAAGAWLVRYPGTRILPREEAVAATETVIRACSRPSWRPDRIARHLAARFTMMGW